MSNTLHKRIKREMKRSRRVTWLTVKTQKFWVLVAFVILLLPLGAAPRTHMKDFFEKAGLHTNTTGPARYEDQAAGHFTGGGFSMRNKVFNTRLAQVELPSARFGNCGDIDLFAGSFSFLSKDQLLNTLRNIISSASSYAFMMGLETISPTVTNNLKQLQSWANQINALNINSCETGMQLASAVWPRSQGASESICRAQSLSGDAPLSDFVAARHGCSDQGHYRDTMRRAGRSLPDLLTDEYNLAWEVMKNDPLFTEIGGRSLKNLFMTISGTVISRKEGERARFDMFPSRALEADFIRKLMTGEALKVYKCQDTGAEDKCLALREEAQTPPAADALLPQVTRILNGLQAKVVSQREEQLTSEEKNLIEKSRLPLLRMIVVISSYRHGAPPLSLNEYAEEIALDLVYQYLREVMSVMRFNITKKRAVQFDSTKLDQFLASLNEVESKLREYENALQRKVSRFFELEKKVRLMEKEMMSRMQGEFQ